MSENKSASNIAEIEVFQCEQVILPVDVTLAYSLSKGSELISDYMYIENMDSAFHTFTDLSSMLGDSPCPTSLFRPFPIMYRSGKKYWVNFSTCVII